VIEQTGSFVLDDRPISFYKHYRLPAVGDPQILLRQRT